MSIPADKDLTSDEALVAFLDGELAPHERARLEALLASDAPLRSRADRLARTRREIAEAFGSLLEDAPTAKLGGFLQAAEAGRAELPAARAASAGRRPAPTAAGLALFILGGAAAISRRSFPSATRPVAPTIGARSSPNMSRSIRRRPSPEPPTHRDLRRRPGRGRQAGRPRPDAGKGGAARPDAEGRHHLHAAGPAARPGRLSIPEGRAGGLLHHRRRPADRAQSFETREGLNIVYWVKGGRAFSAGRHAPRADL